MTPHDAAIHLVNEFVIRFGCDAESCTDPEKTKEAVKVLLGLQKCPCRNCVNKRDLYGE